MAQLTYIYPCTIYPCTTFFIEIYSLLG